ncbi:hypothetical protein MLD38_020565 [Melastoma candidum]|uniref:Uncharacterized protein n=1 Tax=Melastoma candidum TaxID=119954 RepID=A0ACB9QGC4_9MYRT|nr:hypothetical protein MLD38_020565 [Melastoma candidum]
MDQHGSKSGGFFQLFDWKAKSRKKLFSSKSESPEYAKQGKRSERNLPRTRVYLMDENETGMEYSGRGNGGFSCSSSVTDDDALGSRGPSVVARLMGLDSMPTSTCPEAYPNPFSDTQSLPDSRSCHRNPDYHHNYPMAHSGNCRSDIEGPQGRPMEEKPQMPRPVCRPLERFQTEVLPPKSAKAIMITRHRLLSPIKSPGFILSRDAAHIMEAAAKIIDAGQDPRTKRKTPALMSSSGNGTIWHRKHQEEQPPSHVLLGVQDNNEKTDVVRRTTSRLSEVSERSLDTSTSKYLKDHSLYKSSNGLETPSSHASSDKEAFPSFRNSGKSISLAVQAKANVQKRGGMPLKESSDMSQMETGEGKPGESFRSQSRAGKNPHKRSPVSNSSVVLRQNNQRQNCTMDKQKPPPEPSYSILQGRKPLSVDTSSQQKTSDRPTGRSKVGSRRMEDTGSGKESSLPNTKNNPRKKQSIKDELHLDKTHARNDSSGDKNKKPVHSISRPNKLPTWNKDSKKDGMDVISFTFTAPLARTTTAPGTLGQVQKSANCMGKRAYSQADSTRSPVVNHIVGGDALSMLLEQKLRELSNEVGSSSHDAASGQSPSTSTSLFQDSTTAETGANSMQKSSDYEERNISWPSSNSFDNSNVFPFKFKNPIKEFDGENYDDKVMQLDFQNLSPSSVLEPSFSAENCFSSETMDGSLVQGNNQSLAHAGEILLPCLYKKPQVVEPDVDLFDSASSLLTKGNVVRKHHSVTISANAMGNNNWEIDYVKAILSNAELMFKDFALGRSREIINPHLFEQMEGRKGFAKSGFSGCRLTRKALFDCVSECTELRCKKFIGGGCKSWAKGLSMVRKKERLAEDIYKEILDYRSLGDSMVDDLVDKDMRSPYGRWVDFEADVFAIGLEIGSNILDSLVDEAIATLF